MDALYYNKLAGGYDSPTAEYGQPPVAQNPQEQEILRRIEYAKLLQAGHGTGVGVNSLAALASLVPSVASAPMALFNGGAALWNGYGLKSAQRDRGAAESE